MRALAALACAAPLVCSVTANVEKAIFVAPGPVALSGVRPSVDDVRVRALSPARPVLALRLPVRFANESMPRGQDSWYLLRRLQDGRRYEVRICWPATQPTDFWLDTFPLTTLFLTPHLVTSLAQYSGQLQDVQVQSEAFLHDESLLFLRVQSAASYFSSNQTLMAYPSPVDVDIILDPFVFNIFPQSLGPFALYVSAVAIGAWFLSGFVYRWLLSVEAQPPEPPSKPHTD